MWRGILPGMDAPATPAPVSKDWTWVLERPCPDCGYDARTVEPTELSRLVTEASRPWAAVLARPDATARPSPRVWSPSEYACHVRDVLRIFDERVRLMLGEDGVRFANWDQDAAARTERYWSQQPATVAMELAAAAADTAATFAAVDALDWTRTGIRSNGSRFTVATLGQYLLHDLRHHLWDVHA